MFCCFDRSKLLRVGMVTPSDDLCSPAVAVNPRTTSGSDYQEVKVPTYIHLLFEINYLSNFITEKIVQLLIGSV